MTRNNLYFQNLGIALKFIYIFWEGHKMTNLRWRFRKILWPSQNIWTLAIWIVMHYFKKILSGQSKNKGRQSKLYFATFKICQEQTKFRVSSKQLLKIILIELNKDIHANTIISFFEEYHIIYRNTANWFSRTLLHITLFSGQGLCRVMNFKQKHPIFVWFNLKVS